MTVFAGNRDALSEAALIRVSFRICWLRSQEWRYFSNAIVLTATCPSVRRT